MNYAKIELLQIELFDHLTVCISKMYLQIISNMCKNRFWH